MTDRRWRGLLLALWAVALVAGAAETFDRTGFGGRPWYGWWDALVVGTAQPYVVAFEALTPAGSTARAGIREGDRADLRELDLDARVHVVWQLPASLTTMLRIHRNGTTDSANVTGSTLWAGSSTRRMSHLLQSVPYWWFLGCSLLIILRRSGSYEARALATLLLLFSMSSATRPTAFLVPNGTVYLLFAVGSKALSFVASVLLVRLTARFGERTPWRSAMEWVAYGMNALPFAGTLAGCYGILTLRFDPIPFLIGPLWGYVSGLAAVTVAIAAILAVARSPKAERPRAGWLLLPLPLMLVASSALDRSVGVTSWSILWVLVLTSAGFSMGGAALVTYALLRRRVLDVGFVLSRSIVVAVVSLIVVAAFVLLEWILGSTLANVSHATGLVANAALALVLGLSMRLIHKRVDAFVDAAMFRKRNEDVGALRDFAKEAAFVTDGDALFDLTIEKLRAHTDARSAALFVREDGSYRAVRSLDVTPSSVNENDPAVLALATWNKPLDPHRYRTAMQGDVALPMVARGRLIGFLLCGEREGSEAYAPDEIEALAELSQGVGMALDGLDRSAHVDPDQLLDAIRQLKSTIERNTANILANTE